LYGKHVTVMHALKHY